MQTKMRQPRAPVHAAGPRMMTRRQLLASSVAAGTALMVGANFVAAPNAAWAMEVKALAPERMATLIQLARDTYPHDRIADRFYASAVKPHDEQAAGDPEHKQLIEAGLGDLDARAARAGGMRYLDIGWEADRVAMLREIEDSPFFQAIRGGLVVGLYNQKELWPAFGYEGSSYEHGGYLDRGFDDITWL